MEIPTRTQDQLQRVKGQIVCCNCYQWLLLVDLLDLHGLLDDGGAIEAFKSLFLELAEYERDLGSRWMDWFQQTLLYR